jgi:hypothetical protein
VIAVVADPRIFSGREHHRRIGLPAAESAAGSPPHVDRPDRGQIFHRAALRIAQVKRDRDRSTAVLGIHRRRIVHREDGIHRWRSSPRS